MFLKGLYRVSLWTCVAYIALRVSYNLFGLEKILSSHYNDPFLGMNISEIVRQNGYNAEENYLTTEDGYKLLLLRVNSKASEKTPIILVHGMFSNPVGFILRGNISLAYFLADRGYDVWLLGYRGSRYSRGHVNLSTNTADYWKFTIDDLGMYDVRSTINYVNEATKKKSIYIGYSLGSTGYFMYSSTFPRENQQLVKGMIGMSPVMNYKNTTTLLRFILPVWSFFESLTSKWHNGEANPIIPTVFGPFLGLKYGICATQYILYLIFGEHYEPREDSILHRLILQGIDPTSAKALRQYDQVLKTDEFKKYDYGPEKNLELYGAETPPHYNVSKITVPMALLVGKTDILSTETNAKQIYAEIQSDIRCGYQEIKADKWNHMDFLIAKDVVPYLNEPILKKVQEFDLDQCVT